MDSTDHLLAVVVKEALLTSVSETSAACDGGLGATLSTEVLRPSEVCDLPEPPQQRWRTEEAPR
jgi:hypothetical protein